MLLALKMTELSFPIGNYNNSLRTKQTEVILRISASTPSLSPREAGRLKRCDISSKGHINSLHEIYLAGCNVLRLNHLLC